MQPLQSGVKEALLLKLRKRHQKTLESSKYKRTRASISLQYGNTVEVRLRLPAKPTADLCATAGILKTRLLPYQARGAILAVCRGRVALADDMGLGKTVQALAMAELLRRSKGIERVLVIAPASVKDQWKTEIEKFTPHTARWWTDLCPGGGPCSARQSLESSSGQAGAISGLLSKLGQAAKSTAREEN